MTREGASIFLPTNFREFITILEGLRVSVHPGRGLRNLAVRPTISPPLRNSEETLLTGEREGEFPILLDVQVPAGSPDRTEQDSTVPTVDVERAVFRSEAERDVVLNRRFDNASPDQIRLEVDASLFSGDGESRFHSGPSSPDEETENWTAADMAAGAVAGALAAARIHPDGGKLIADFIGGELEPVSLMDVVDGDRGSRAASAAVNIIRSSYGKVGQDGLSLLGEFVAGLSTSQVASDLQAFSDHVSAVLDADQVRPRGSLSDEKNLLLRSLSIVVQRSTLEDVLADRIEGELPGPRVLIAAAALAGLREGLAHLPSSLKSDHAELLGRMAAVTEDSGPSIATIREIAAQAGIMVSDATASVTTGSQTQALEICPWRQNAMAKRVLSDVQSLPATWRVFLRDDGMLCLDVQSEDASELEAAAAMISAWRKRTRSSSQTRRKTGKPADTNEPSLF